MSGLKFEDRIKMCIISNNSDNTIGGERIYECGETYIEKIQQTFEKARIENSNVILFIQRFES